MITREPKGSNQKYFMMLQIGIEKRKHFILMRLNKCIAYGKKQI